MGVVALAAHFNTFYEWCQILLHPELLLLKVHQWVLHCLIAFFRLLALRSEITARQIAVTQVLSHLSSSALSKFADTSRAILVAGDMLSEGFLNAELFHALGVLFQLGVSVLTVLSLGFLVGQWVGYLPNIGPVDAERRPRVLHQLVILRMTYPMQIVEGSWAHNGVFIMGDLALNLRDVMMRVVGVSHLDQV